MEVLGCVFVYLTHLVCFLDVLKAADYLCFDCLKTALGEHLSKLISHDTVLKIYIYHEINNLQLHNLSKECVSYIDEDLAVLNSPEFLKLSEEHLTTLLSRDTLLVPEREVLVAVLRWKEHT